MSTAFVLSMRPSYGSFVIVKFGYRNIRIEIMVGLLWSTPGAVVASEAAVRVEARMGAKCCGVLKCVVT